jgi:hypothetical protein
MLLLVIKQVRRLPPLLIQIADVLPIPRRRIHPGPHRRGHKQNITPPPRQRLLRPLRGLRSSIRLRNLLRHCPQSKTHQQHRQRRTLLPTETNHSLPLLLPIIKNKADRRSKQPPARQRLNRNTRKRRARRTASHDCHWQKLPGRRCSRVPRTRSCRSRQTSLYCSH